MAIGADLVDRYHRAGAGAPERVAGGAFALENRLGLGRGRRLRRSANGYFGGWTLADVVLDAAQARHVAAGRCCSTCACRDRSTSAWSPSPSADDRTTSLGSCSNRPSASAMPSCRFRFHSGTMSELPTVSSTGCRRRENFTGLNGSMRPRPHSVRVCIHSLSRLQPQQPPPRRRDDGEPVEQAVESRQPVVLRDLAEDRVGVEAGIRRAGNQEPQVLLLPV